MFKNETTMCIVKTFLKLIYRDNTIPIKIPVVSWRVCENSQANSKMCMETKRIKKNQDNLE